MPQIQLKNPKYTGIGRLSTDYVNELFGKIPDASVVEMGGKFYKKTGAPNTLGANRLTFSPYKPSEAEKASAYGVDLSPADINTFGTMAPAVSTPENPPGGRILSDPKTGQVLWQGQGELPNWVKTYQPGQTPQQTGQPKLGAGGNLVADLLNPEAYKQQRDKVSNDLLQISMNPPVEGERKDAQVGKSYKEAIAGVFGGAPTAPPSLAGQYQSMRQQSGVVDAETELNTATSDLKALENEILTQKEKITGITGVSSRYISGRLTKLSAENSEALRSAENRVSEAKTMLNNKNQTLTTLMSLTQQDYNNAQQNYQFEINKRLQLYGILSQEQNRIEDNAKANLTLLMTQMTNSGIGYEDLDEDAKLTFDNLSTQAGMGASVASFIGKNVEGKKLSIDSRVDEQGNEFWDVLYQNPDGGLETKTIFKGRGKATDGAPIFYDTSGNKISAFDAARLIVESNPTLSENDLVNAIRENVMDNKGNSVVDVGDAQRIAKESISKRPAPTAGDIRQKIVGVLTPLKDTYSKDEAKTMAENQLKTALNIKTEQLLPASYQKAIEDALGEVYGKTWWQSFKERGQYSK